MNETPKRPKYDSAEAHTCNWCGESISPGQQAVIYGTGNSLRYFSFYHRGCDQRRISLLLEGSDIVRILSQD
jgi:hypothetical protein